MTSMTPMTIDDFLGMRRADLARVLAGGHAIDPAALDDTEYRGISLGLPRIVEKLTWKTFKKVFHRDPSSGQLRGWNVRIHQAGVHGAHEYRRRRDGTPLTWGHYRVVAGRGRRSPRASAHALLLDYGTGGNRWLDPARAIRDPLVAVHQGSSELLLGWTYLELGALRIPTPSYFLLVRDCPLSHVALPPATRTARLPPACPPS